MLTRTLAVLSMSVASVAIAADANVVDLPAIGVRFTDFPADLLKPHSEERPNGYEAIVQVDFATLTLYRDDNPVPPDLSVTDPVFQQRLLDQLKKRDRHVEKSELTHIGGQDAWLMEGSYPVGPATAVFDEAYVIVDHHITRISAAAIGSPRTSPDFQKAAQLMSAISFEPVVREAKPPPPPPPPEEQMPPFVPGPAGMYYPSVAQRKSEQGVVDVSFNIDMKGMVQNLTLDYIENEDLSKNIPAFLQYGSFRVPSDWAHGGPERRFKVEFQFRLTNSPAECSADRTPRVQGAKIMHVCGPPLL